MFGGRNPVPLVLRTKVAMGSGYGSQHLMDPAGIFATSPGWRIMAASTPFDYVGLMNAALAVDDPVLMLEHVDLYAAEGEIPVDDLDYQIPFGTAAVRRAGSEVTVLSYLSMVARRPRRSSATGIDAELIDLRFLDRASLDWDTVGASVRKTNAVLIVEQGALGTSYGGWLADEIQRRFFDWLDQPVQRVTGGRVVPVDLPGPRAGGDRDDRGNRRRACETGCGTASPGKGTADGRGRADAERAGRRDRGGDRPLARLPGDIVSRRDADRGARDREGPGRVRGRGGRHRRAARARRRRHRRDRRPHRGPGRPGETDADIDAALGAQGLRRTAPAPPSPTSPRGARKDGPSHSVSRSARQRFRRHPPPSAAVDGPTTTRGRCRGYQRAPRGAAGRGGCSPARWCASWPGSAASTWRGWQGPGRTGGSCGGTWSDSLRRLRRPPGPRRSGQPARRPHRCRGVRGAGRRSTLTFG